MAKSFNRPGFKELETARKESETAREAAQRAEQQFKKVLEQVTIHSDHIHNHVQAWALNAGNSRYFMLLEQIGRINQFLNGHEGQLAGIFERYEEPNKTIQHEGAIWILGEPKITAQRHDSCTYHLTIPSRPETTIYHGSFFLCTDAEFAEAREENSDRYGGANPARLVQSSLRFEDFAVIGYAPPYTYELRAGTERVLRFADEFLWNWRVKERQPRPGTISRLVELCQSG